MADSDERDEDSHDERDCGKEFLRPSFLKKFINAYRSFPCLWKVTCKEYSNQMSKGNAYERLVELSKQVNPKANVDWVKARIKNLRTVFRKEFKKVECSKRLGSGIEDIHVPKLWYFDLLLFTADQETPRKPQSSYQEDNGTISLLNPVIYRNENEFETLEAEIEQRYITRNMNSHQSVELFKKPIEKDRKKKRKADIDKEENNEDVFNLTNCTLKRPRTMDEYDAYAITVAAKLRKMESNQRIFAEFHINNILFTGLMGRLEDPYTPQTSPSPRQSSFQQYPYALQASSSPETSPSSHQGSVEDVSIEPSQF